jgi:hypothetical protein
VVICKIPGHAAEWPLCFLLRPSRRTSEPAELGGYLPLALAVISVCYPIPERIFDHVSTGSERDGPEIVIRSRIPAPVFNLLQIGGLPSIRMKS